MKILTLVFMALSVLTWRPSSVGAEWINVSKGLPDKDIQAIAIDAKNPSVIYAASGRDVFKTEDNGLTWKRILGARGEENSVRVIYVDVEDSRRVFVGSEKGIHFSDDGGKRWKPVFKGLGRIFCLSRHAGDSAALWVGTDDGLFRLNTRNKS